MVNHICNICSKQFKRRVDLIYHMEKKKKPCQPVLQEFAGICTDLQKFAEFAENTENIENIEINTCKYCEKNFSSIYTLNRHLNNYCKAKKLQDNINNEYKQKLEEQTKKMEEMYKMIEELKQKPTNITINNTDNSIKNSVNNNVNNIKLMAHGSEDLSKIETKTILKYLCSDKFESIIPNVTKEIFRNKARPEFLNLEVTDLARNKSRYYDGDNWVTGNANDCVMTVFENVNSRILEPFEKDNIEKTVNMIIKDTELKPNYKTINHSRNYCGKLFSEDKEYVEQRTKICENIKNMMYSKKCAQIK